jgi:SAM-dependent methyltransferase
MTSKHLASKTREIESLPIHLLKKGKVYLLPVYYMAKLSRVGSELALNQGSAEYQDLIYRNQPEGRLFVGKIFDKYLLNFPTAKDCRSRLAATQQVLKQLIVSSPVKDIVIVDLGCGYARGLIGTLAGVKDRKVVAHGMDMDEKAVEVASSRAQEQGLTNVTFSVGNAVNHGDYPVKSADIVILNGLAQYLPSHERMQLYHSVHSLLNQNGYLITDYFCDWAKNPVQKWWKGISEDFLGVKLDWLGKEAVEEMFARLPFRDVKTWYSQGNLCLMVLARK